MKNIFLLLFAAAMLCSSCASLTKSQVEAVKQFAHTSKDFSAYPSKIQEAVARVRVERGLYAAYLLDNTELHTAELDSIFSQKKQDLHKAAAIDITFKIIDEYAKSLLLLASDKYATDLGTQAGSLGTNLDSLINTYNALPKITKVPGGIGGLVGNLIMAGGKQWVRSKQATEIKRYVTQADTLVNVMTGNLLTFLNAGSLADIIDHEETEIQNNYKAYLDKLHAQDKHPGLEDGRAFINLLGQMDDIKILRQQTILATGKLQKAHHKLFEDLQEKKDIKAIVAELQAFYDDVSAVRATIQAIEKSQAKATAVQPL